MDELVGAEHLADFSGHHVALRESAATAQIKHGQIFRYGPKASELVTDIVCDKNPATPLPVDAVTGCGCYRNSGLISISVRLETV